MFTNGIQRSSNTIFTGLHANFRNNCIMSKNFKNVPLHDTDFVVHILSIGNFLGEKHKFSNSPSPIHLIIWVNISELKNYYEKSPSIKKTFVLELFAVSAI